MDWDQWKQELAVALGKYGVDGEDYIRQTGDECWREMFDDGLTPTDAASEEAWAASQG